MTFNFYNTVNMNRKPILILLALLVASTALMAQTQQQRLEKHLYYLASDSLQGRKAGSDDGRKAAAYIEDEYRQMGLQPFGGTYRHYFLHSYSSIRGRSVPVSADSVDYYAAQDKTVYCNLVGIIEGSDPVLKNEYIVVGGHYDHLGVKDGEVYNGADDNASGTASVTEVARQLLARRGDLKRSVIICAFDAEELGLFGSHALSVEMQQLGMIDRVKMMMSVDMVGWLKKGRHLRLTGTGTLKDCAGMINEVASQTGLPVSTSRFESSPFTATDTEPFAKRGVPTLAVTTGTKSPYHKPEDDADLIDYEGLSLITDYMAAFTLRAANQPGQLASGKVAPKHRDKVSPFNLGLSLGYNSAWLRFPDAAFNGKSRLGWHGGIAMQCNFNKTLSLHSDILYTYTRSLFPNIDDLFNSSQKLTQQSVTIPLMLRLSVGDHSSSLYISAGGYYSYNLQSGFYYSEEPCRTHQWGWGFDFGFRLGYNWDLRCMMLYQINPLFNDAAMPRTLNTYSAFTLTYYLL